MAQAYATAMPTVRPTSRRPRPLDSEAFGQRLRSIRQERSWTLAELAKRSGVSIPTISRAERGQLALGYDNFQALARALDLDLGVMFGSPALQTHPFREPVVTRAGAGSVYRGAHSTYEFLAAEALGKRMVPATGVIHARRFPPPGDETRHAGEEFVYVLSGTLEVRVADGRTLRLGAGDAVYLDSRRGHAYRSVGRQLAKVVAVMSEEPAGLAPAAPAAAAGPSVRRASRSSPAPRSRTR